jgi:hypothetical protein
MENEKLENRGADESGDVGMSSTLYPSPGPRFPRRGSRDSLLDMGGCPPGQDRLAVVQSVVQHWRVVEALQ